MSFAQYDWAFAQHQTTPTQRLVLLALADHADARNFAWPGVEKLIERTGLSKATVYRALSDLKRDHLIVPRDDDGRAVVELLLTVSPREKYSEDESRLSHAENRTIQGNRSRTEQEPRGGVATEDIEQVWSHYLSKPGKRNRPLPGEERRIITNALKVRTADECCKAIDGNEQSDFHQKRREYVHRDGPKYNGLSQIIKGKQGGKTTGEQIDYFIGLVEITPVAGSGLPSADPAVIARKKQDVQRGHRLKGDPIAMKTAQEAEAWLKQGGIEVDRSAADGYPTFTAV